MTATISRFRSIQQCKTLQRKAALLLVCFSHIFVNFSSVGASSRSIFQVEVLNSCRHKHTTCFYVASAWSMLTSAAGQQNPWSDHLAIHYRWSALPFGLAIGFFAGVSWIPESSHLQLISHSVVLPAPFSPQNPCLRRDYFRSRLWETEICTSTL